MNSIRFSAIGDVHISKRHLPLSIEAMNNCVSLLKKRHNVDLVVIMGDILDTHDNVKMSIQRRAINWINDLVKVANGKNIAIVVLIGNHDRVSNMDVFSDTHPFMGIEDIPNRLYIVNKPKAVIVNNHKVLFMPYVPPGKFIESFESYLQQLHKSKKWLKISGIKDFSLIFAHQEFSGAPYGPIVSTKGDKWPLDFPMVISGHIHQRVRIQENILYTGSLYPITTSESNDKGVILGEYNPESKSLTFNVVSVVSSTKKVITVSASDEESILEMLNLDREHTKYIISGSSEEIAGIKQRVKGKNLNIAYNIQVEKPKETTQNSDFDTLLKEKCNTPELSKLLEEILS